MSQAELVKKGLMAFSIGPVQEFISTARTVRDLWTGSYLLSWLTARAMATVLENGGSLVFSSDETNPIIELLRKKEQSEWWGKDKALLSGLPNLFQARAADAATARAMAEKCRVAVLREWKDLAEKVRQELDKKWRQEWPGWDAGWNEQVGSFWDIRIAWLPEGVQLGTAERELRLSKGGAPDEDSRRQRLLWGLMGLQKTVRHYPMHEPPEETRPKCSLCGARSQMGPRAGNSEDPMQKATSFTENAAPKAHLAWQRLQKKDRFCAVELIKRFAWGVYLCENTGFHGRPQEKRVWDTATHAAMEWMKQLRQEESGEKELLHERVEVELMRKHAGVHWSGQWLHWRDGSEADDDDEKEAYQNIAQPQINAARQQAREKGLGAPPTYYAILMFDGDRMGKHLNDSLPNVREKIVESLGNFALEKVPELVAKANGELIYGGGDDVLAMVSTANALSLARDVNNAFRAALASVKNNKSPFTASAGIVVAHYKFDLREAMDIARRTEKRAKNDGRNRLALTILRRSGEHTTASCSWEQVVRLIQLVDWFKQGMTDRWAYHLRAVLQQLVDAEPCHLSYAAVEKSKDTRCETMPEIPKILDMELRRLVHRAEFKPLDGGCMKPVEFQIRLEKLWKILSGACSEEGEQELELPPDNRLPQQADALTLIQSASFLARGKEE